MENEHGIDEAEEAMMADNPECFKKTDICPICGDEKPVDDQHRNCGK